MNSRILGYPALFLALVCLSPANADDPRMVVNEREAVKQGLQ